jgi:heptosyltransferase II
MICQQDIKGKNVHIINPHGIGDVVMMVPLVAKVLHYNPSQLSFTLKSPLEAEVLQLFFSSASFNYVFMQSIYKNKAVVALFFYVRSLRKLHLDLILTAFGTNPKQASIVSFFSGASVRIGWKNKFDFLNTSSLYSMRGLHKVNKHLNLLDNKSRVPSLFPHEYFQGDQSMIGNIREKLFELGVNFKNDYLIAIAPGSGDIESHKRWPIEKYRELIDKFATVSRIKFVLVGSNSEQFLGREIASGNNNTIVINQIGKLTITETAHLLSFCKLAVCNCNGLSHLAAGVGINVLGLYGPTNPYLTGPYSDKFQSISLSYNCSPCYQKGFIRGCGEPLCMIDIPVSLVYKKIMNILQVNE